MQELLQRYITDLLDLLYRAWTAPPDQAAQLIGCLVQQLLMLLILFLVGRWLWNKLF